MLPERVNLFTEESPITDKIQKEDRIWILSLYGTAIGAGTLFLPINAGLHGIIPLLIMAILAFPMTYFSHQALCRFVLSGKMKSKDITEVVEQHFGKFAGNILTTLYFLAIYPILLMYSVALTNTTESFIINQLQLPAPPRAALALSLILLLMFIIRLGQETIVKAMSVLVYPFIAILFALSIYLIPHWNSAIFDSSVINNESQGLSMTIWLLIPVMVFSFNHSPIISSFAVKQKERYGENANKKASIILKYSHLLMLLTVMFFVFSCVFSLSQSDLALAKKQNISILSYLANHFNSPIIAYVAPFIAFIAIAKSFFGHYLGAREGLQGLILRISSYRNKELCQKKLYSFIEIFIIVSCFTVATLNPNILSMIETLGGPIIAIILFIMPIYAIYKVPAMKKYQRPVIDAFILFIGLITLSAIFYGLLF